MKDEIGINSFVENFSKCKMLGMSENVENCRKMPENVHEVIFSDENCDPIEINPNSLRKTHPNHLG